MFSERVWLCLQAGLAVTIVLVAGYLAYYVVKYLRGATSKDDTSVGDLTLNFEEMRRDGDISEAEFRTIKSVLGKTHGSPPTGDQRSN